MRILHFSDVHIGVESYGRPATEADITALSTKVPAFAADMSLAEKMRTYAGLSTRLLDFLAALDQVVQQAIERHVDLALFCGDAYKSRDPSQTQQREFARRMARLVGEGIPVLLVVGNHDQPHSLGRATALDIFPTLHRATDIMPQMVVADRVATCRMETRSGPLQVVTVPWVRRGAFLGREEHRGKTLEQLTQHIQDELTERIAAEAAKLDSAVPALLAGHVTVDGGMAGSEQPMTLGRDHSLMRSAVALPQFAYVALGHLHKHQVIGTTPPVVYAGSLQAVDFGEEGDTKGFCIVEIDSSKKPGHRMHWEFVPVQSRPFVTVDVTLLADDKDVTARVLEAISRRPIQDAMVRVRIAGAEEAMRRLNDKAIRAALEPAHAVVAVTREVAREKRLRMGSPATGLAPDEALKKYLDSRQQVSTAAKARALEVGKRLIQEGLAKGEEQSF